MNIKFHGAAKTVTGSCYEVNTGKHHFLVDCGMFQGPDVFPMNYEEFKFDPGTIDFVLLTHAHIDHSGLLPKLITKGFNGKIYTTTATHEICKHILLDSARVQESNLRFRGELPIYNLDDASKTLTLFKPINFDEEQVIDNKFKFTYKRASHVLGAASVELEIFGTKLVFSGDIGRENPTIIESFNKEVWDPNYVIMEALYGDKNHPDYEESVANLANIINNTIDSDGNVIIPAFALHRTQELLVILNQLKKDEVIRRDVQIFLDSPLATKILNLYTDLDSYHSHEFKKRNDPFGFGSEYLQIVKSANKSKRLKRARQSIIIAGGGMADGGRVVSHIQNFINKENHAIVFVGFQAEETLGRTLVEKPTSVNIRGKDFAVKANIHQLSGFSAHGDRDDLKTWLEKYSNPQLNNVILVHADEDKSIEFKKYIADLNVNVTIPEMFDEIEI